MILMWLLFSIFSNIDINKFKYLGMVIFYLIVSGVILLVTSVFLSINQLFNYSIPVDNTVAVIIFFSAISIIIIVIPYVDKLYYSRFNLFTTGENQTKKSYFNEIKEEGD